MSPITPTSKKAPLTSSTAPNTDVAVPSGSERTVTFDANGETHTATVDLNAYTTKAMQAHNVAVKSALKVEDEAEQDNLLTEAGMKLALLGTKFCTAFADLTIEELWNGNFNLVNAFTTAVREVVFPSSSDSTE